MPLTGNDLVVPAETEPTAPLAPSKPNFNNYSVNVFTIVDLQTNLEWQRQDDGIDRSWGDAWDYCANLNLVGLDRWRLPNPTELQSLVDYDIGPAPLIYSQFTSTEASEYWTASSSLANPDLAWAVNFNNGYIYFRVKTQSHLVRCVR